MKKEVVELLYEALLDLGFDTDEVHIRDDYSGRGMYGQSTHALTGDFSGGSIACAVACVWESGEAQEAGLDPDDFRYVQDQMGLGIVIY